MTIRAELSETVEIVKTVNIVQTAKVGKKALLPPFAKRKIQSENLMLNPMSNTQPERSVRRPWRLAARRLLMIACVALAVGQSVYAQDVDEITQQFKKISPEEDKRLRAILAEPVPEGVLNSTLENHFKKKREVAAQLSDLKLEIDILREAEKQISGSFWQNQLGRTLALAGQSTEANKWTEKALQTENNPVIRSIYSSRHARELFSQYRLAEASEQIKIARGDINSVAGKTMAAIGRITLERSRSILSAVEADVALQKGETAQALAASAQAEALMRNALKQQDLYPEVDRILMKEQMARTFSGKIRAEEASGQFSLAEKTLSDFLRFAKQTHLPPSYLASIYHHAGTLRFSQRSFKSAEQAARQGLRTLDQLGANPMRPDSINLTRSLFLALSGQGKHAAALAEIQRLDALAGVDENLKARVQHGFWRGWVYLGNNKFSDAVPLFASEAKANASAYGERHFLSAQAAGLQGVALWRSGAKTQALPLLQAAVRDYMSTANADFQGDHGLRREMRDAVFAAYLEAVTTLAPDEARAAIAAADWVRSGSVQDALSDAAVRAAASGSGAMGSAIVDLVRREQDAKNEVKALRDYLSGEAGSTRSTLPEVAAKMRERIALLETSRIDLQKQIKAQFPDYDRLVRPSAPSVADIQARLKPDEALLMLLPTTDAVYVWAVTQDGGSQFHRASMSQEALSASIQRLRRTLDLGNMGRTLLKFDASASSELYAQLLKPLEAHFKTKSQLVVAAGGALGQIPFSLLQTSAHTGALKDAPWLIRQMSITHVPSLGAWLALQSSQNRKAAAQPLMAWGDPVFNLAAAGSTKAAVRSVNLTRATTPVDLEKEAANVGKGAVAYAEVPALPETRDELLAIAKALNAKGSDLIMGLDATRESVLKANASGALQQQRVLAFATHGLMAGDLPNLTQPALAMTATGKEAADPLSPLLTLEDVLNLKLNADWVVLSACNTAASDGKAEEALSGLARGFFYAGSRSLLVTHWSVDSESAKELTVATFSHYTQNPSAPKAESLRQAMLKVMANPSTEHPAHWAPYALVGDGGR